MTNGTIFLNHFKQLLAEGKTATATTIYNTVKALTDDQTARNIVRVLVHSGLYATTEEMQLFNI